MSRHANFLASLLPLTAIVAPSAAPAASETRFEFRLDPQQLDAALLAVSRRSGRQIVFAADLVAGKHSRRLAGRFTPEEAVQRLLQGSGLTWRDAEGALIIVPQPDAAQLRDDVIVTGTRIRGAERYSQVQSLSRDALRAQGQSDLGDAVRTIPQNFGGGQSPYIGFGAQDYGSDNITSGSAINLRGVGPDATLTLLNGRRFAYDGIAEGVDVASIPLAALDRIEVVADGASAIYGSDAVAGVANVILRRDFSGLETAARLGAATDGGDGQRQVEAVAGDVWSNGGIVATASYDHNSAITADQRGFSQILDKSSVILPRTDHVAAVISGHQSLGGAIEADLDLLYSRRVAARAFSNTTGDYTQDGIDGHTAASSFVASPAIKIGTGKRWSATIAATYARDDTGYRTRYWGGGAVLADYQGSYNNESVSAEASAEGVLATLAGGETRLAVGAGYRWVGLTGRSEGGSLAPSVFEGSRESFYGFGELNVPLVSRLNRRAGLERLSLTAAGRFEHYPRIGDVFTPKLGWLYAPSKIIEFRGTWGRSFKAPTLYELFQAQNAYVLGAAAFGGTTYPASSTAIYAYGGNQQLKPQRATTWSVGASLYPLGDRRLTIDASYFDIRYTNRIVAPISSGATALSNPLVADLIEFNPSAAQTNALIAGTQLGLFNFTGAPFDPASVVAIIDDRNRNVAVERYHGVDVAATWRLPLTASASLALNASATYLSSERQLSELQPDVPLAGHIFEPAHFRGRGGATVSSGGLTASVFLSVTGGVEDDRFAPIVEVRGQRTVDLSAGYAFPASSGPLRGSSLQVSLLNAFDDQPARIRSSYGFETPFDATNYSPVGRFISVRIAKKW